MEEQPKYQTTHQPVEKTTYGFIIESKHVKLYKLAENDDRGNPRENLRIIDFEPTENASFIKMNVEFSKLQTLMLFVEKAGILIACRYIKNPNRIKS